MPSTINKSFDIRQTNIAKGIACLLLLFHHLFYNSPEYFERFTPLITTGSGVPLACVFAPLGKVCVAMFLLLSGYGMSCVLKKHNNSFSVKSSALICAKQLWKLWTNYIFIFVLFVPWQFLFNHMPYTGIQDLIADIFGLSFLFGTPTMNGTWWYMTIAILSYILTPLFYWLFNKNRGLAILSIVTLMGIFIQFTDIYWIVFYFCGFILHEYNYFDIVSECFNKHRIATISILLACLLFFTYYRFVHAIFIWDLLLSLGIITISYLLLSKIKVVSAFLSFLGKHSGNIFMFHTFIYLYDFQNIIYAPKYAPLIYVFLLLVCIGVSVLIEIIKKFTSFNKFVNYIGGLMVKPKSTEKS